MARKLTLSLVCSFIFLNSLFALSEEEVYQQTAEISSQILSPFCPGRILSDCPSNPARELKEEIRTKLENGASKEEVMQELYALYGDDLRAAPEFASFGLLAWLMPAVFLLLGAIAIYLFLNKTAKSAPDNNDLPYL